MNADQAKALRAPFPPGEIGKLPRIYCAECRKAPSKACQQHPAAKCRECGNKHSTASLHLDYVGHAETTDRLLEVDPDWNWEPLAVDPTGLPVFDRNGGLWIKLTVAGVTRLGYGNAEGKTGGDAVKEILGDAIRNSAMRFGVALDLWRKTDRAEQVAEHSSPATRSRPAPVAPVAESAPTPAPAAVTPPEPPRAAPPRPAQSEASLTPGQLRHIQTLFSKTKYKDPDARHAFIAEKLGIQVANTNELTTSQASRLVDELNAIPKAPVPIAADPWAEAAAQ